MNRYEQRTDALRREPKVWLVTGCAGFIGSNLLETLLGLDQTVIGLDNFSTGYRHNVDAALASCDESQRARFEFVEGDVSDPDVCARVCEGVDYVLHQAALGSVPRSINDPLNTNRSNVTGFLTLLDAAKNAGVSRFVFASSSSVYGDSQRLPKVEEEIGECLSPYAVSKRVDELYAAVFGRVYGIQTVGLRYFNVFGRRQDPLGAYAAVIPKWVKAMIEGEAVEIYGDGQTSRDFCYIDNVVQANVLAATVEDPAACSEVYNVAVGGRTTLEALFGLIRSELSRHVPSAAACEPGYGAFRPGDVRHSNADISKARRLLGYEPTHTIEAGMRECIAWYVEHA